MLLLGISAAALWCSLQQPSIEVQTVSVEPKPPFTVVLDAGHGGFDGGATTAEGVPEKGVNLAISNRLADLLSICGAEVVQTRRADTALGGEVSGSKKTADIKARLALFQQHPEALVVSVHQNHFPEAQYRGAQMFYGVKNPASTALAESLQQRFYALQPENNRVVKEGPTSVYLLQKTENPMVLAECGFLSNPEEAAKLLDSGYQSQIAFTLFCGLTDYQAKEEENT